MKRSLYLFIVVVIVALCAAPAFGAGDAAAGKDLYMKKCKACHAENGAGTPAMLKKFGEKLKPLASKEIQGLKDPELAKAIQGGDNHKALAKTLTPADLDNLVAHIRTLK